MKTHIIALCLVVGMALAGEPPTPTSHFTSMTVIKSEPPIMTMEAFVLPYHYYILEYSYFPEYDFAWIFYDVKYAGNSIRMNFHWWPESGFFPDYPVWFRVIDITEGGNNDSR